LESITVFFALLAGLLIAYQVYAYIYFRSQKFISLKESISDYTNECNELNAHIEELKYMQSHAASVIMVQRSFPTTANTILSDPTGLLV
jgi:hypothetical protein